MSPTVTSLLYILLLLKNLGLCLLPEEREACRQSLFQQTDKCRTISKTCKKLEIFQMERVYINLILYYHNDVRNKVAGGKMEKEGWPPARNMNELYYDSDRALISRCAVAQCDEFKKYKDIYDEDCELLSFNHYHTTTTSQESVAEIIDDAMRSWLATAPENDTSVIDSYTKGEKESNFDIKHSPFTQMVWAKSSHINCRVSKYASEENETNALVYCFYYEPGNIASQPVYLQGESTSVCPNKLISSNYEYLCDIPEQDRTHHNSAIIFSKDFSKLAVWINLNIVFAIMKSHKISFV